MSTPAGYAFALILFFGGGRGRGGRATAKPADSRRTSADGFAVKWNGHRTEIAFSGWICYTQVSKLTDKIGLERSNYMLHWIAIVLGVLFIAWQLFYTYMIICSLIENTGRTVFSIIVAICHSASPVAFVFWVISAFCGKSHNMEY